MAMISNDWLAELGTEFKKPYYAKLYEFIKNEYNTKQVFPPSDEIFTAFHLTALKDVKVVIIGQDPYHNDGQAHGLCFSVKPEVDIPPSLDNIYKNGGRVDMGMDAVEWAIKAEKLGAGEILLTSMDGDGTKAGYDIALTKAISSAVKIPVIASGGAGTMEHFYEALTEGGAEAALAASLFHYKELEIREVKRYLQRKGVSVRL